MFFYYLAFKKDSNFSNKFQLFWIYIKSSIIRFEPNMFFIFQKIKKNKGLCIFWKILNYFE